MPWLNDIVPEQLKRFHALCLLTSPYISSSRLFVSWGSVHIKRYRDRQNGYTVPNGIGVSEQQELHKNCMQAIFIGFSVGFGLGEWEYTHSVPTLLCNVNSIVYTMYNTV